MSTGVCHPTAFQNLRAAAGAPTHSRAGGGGGADAKRGSGTPSINKSPSAWNLTEV